MLALLLSLSALSFYVAAAIVHRDALRFATSFVPVRRPRLVFVLCVALWPLPWILSALGIYLQVEDADGNLDLRIRRAR